MAQTVDDLCYAYISLRGRRYNSLTPKKRRNKKEVRDRQTAMAKRESQRDAYERQLENDRKRLEELNLQLDPKYLKKQQLREQTLNARQEKAKLYLEAMVRDAAGEAPTGLNETKRLAYNKRVEELRCAFSASPKVCSEYNGQSRLFASMLQKVSA